MRDARRSIAEKSSILVGQALLPVHLVPTTVLQIIKMDRQECLSYLSHFKQIDPHKFPAAPNAR